MSAIKDLFKQTLIYGVGNIGVRFINFIVLTPWFTNVLSQSEYGLYSEYYAYTTFFIVLLTFGLETTYFRYTAKYNRESIIFTTALLLITLLSAVFAVLFISSRTQIIHLSGNQYNNSIVYCFVLVTIFDSIGALPFARLRKQNKAGTYSLLKVVEIGLFIGVNYIFLSEGKIFSGLYNSLHDIFHFQTKVEHVFYANVFSSFIKLLILLPVFMPVNFSLDKKLVREIIFFTAPLALSQLAGVLNDVLDRLLFRYLLDNNDAMFQLGIYAANLKIAIAVNLLIQVFRYAAEPFFMSKSEDADAKEIYARVMYFFVIVVCMSGCLVYGNLNLVKHLIDEKFYQGLAIVPVLIAANVIYGIYYNLSVWYKVSELTKFALVLTLIGIVVNSGINVLYLPKYGYHAAAMARLVAYLVMLVVSYFLSLKYYPIPYNLRKIVKIIILALVLFIIFNFTNKYLGFIPLIINNIIILLLAYYINLKENVIANLFKRK